MIVHLLLIYLYAGHHVLQIHAGGDHRKWAFIETQAGRKYLEKMPSDVQHSSGDGNSNYDFNHSHTYCTLFA